MTKRLCAALLACVTLVLVACGSAAAPAPAPSVPWQDGDVLVYQVYEEYKLTESTMTYTFTRGEQGWWVNSTFDSAEGQVFQATLYDGDSLQALQSSYDYRPANGEGGFILETTYADGQMIVRSNLPDAPAEQRVTWPKGYGFYDNETLLMALRLFPMELGQPFGFCFGIPYQSKAEIATVGAKEQKTLKFNGEDVPVYGVRVGRSGSMKSPMMTVWLTPDERRLPLRLDGPRICYILTGVEYAHLVQ